MNIPFVDLHQQYLSIKKEIDEAIQNVITETAFIGGKYVKEFENSFKELYGVKHCIPVANGTDSLYIIMKMLGIGKGDEVITPANSWISSSETISETGATPVFIDIDPVFYTMDETKLEALITEKTKAIMPVHIFGQMCEMDSILKIAKAHNLFVIEDSAQAHFSQYKGVYSGLSGTAGSFSFYPGKNLGAYGDAGCIITNDDELADNCRMYANHGALVKHQHKFEGMNSRLDGLQAAILSVKLKSILDWTQKRIDNAAFYTSLLKDVEQISIPETRPDTTHTFHLYVIRAKDRTGLQSFLKKKGISTGIHYPHILPALEAYSYLKVGPENYPEALKAQDEILSLPMYPELTHEQMEYVAANIKSFYRR